MDKAQTMALIVAILMVASIVGYSVIYSGPQIEKPTNTTPPTTNPVQLAMQASNVPATVVLILPKISFVASTEQSNINVLDSAIMEIEGVRGVASRYSMGEETQLGTGLIYIAEVQLLEQTDPALVLEKLDQISELKTIAGFPYALIEIPKSIEFTHADLNLSKIYDLERNEAQVIISVGTLVGDEIVVSLEANFLGNDVLEMNAYEEENPALESMDGIAVFEAEISSLESSLELEIRHNYSTLLELDAIESEINGIEGATGLELSKQFIDAKIMLALDTNLSEQTSTDLNDFLHTLSDDVIFYNKDFFRASLFFEQGENLIPTEEAIQEKLDELKLDASIGEPFGRASGTVQLEGNAGTVRNLIESMLENKDLEFTLFQQGQVLLEEITDEETATTYAIESGLVDAKFISVHAAGETVEMEFSYSILRNAITAITAEEK